MLISVGGASSMETAPNYTNCVRICSRPIRNGLRPVQPWTAGNISCIKHSWSVRWGKTSLKSDTDPRVQTLLQGTMSVFRFATATQDAFSKLISLHPHMFPLVTFCVGEILSQDIKHKTTMLFSVICWKRFQKCWVHVVLKATAYRDRVLSNVVNI